MLSKNSKSPKAKPHGFTLLEMILVLAIASVLAMAGISSLLIKTRNLKVDKAAVQMQEWMQAALSYYGDNGYWPKAPPYDLAGGGALRTLMDAGYMPHINISSANPWGGPYYGHESSSAVCKKCFEITATIPKSAANSESIAQELAGRLPFGRVDIDTPNQVKAVITNLGSNAGGDTIRWIGYINAQNPTLPEDLILDCPNGTDAMVYVAVNGFYNPTWTKDTTNYPIYSLNYNGNTPMSKPIDAKSLGSVSNLIDIAYPNIYPHQPNPDSNSGQMLAVVSCGNTTTKNKTNNAQLSTTGYKY